MARITMVTWLHSGRVDGLRRHHARVAGPHLRQHGWFLLLLIFAGVILGGHRVGLRRHDRSLLIGVTQELSTHSAIGLPSDLKMAVAFVVLILVLLVRPQGIMGKKQAL